LDAGKEHVALQLSLSDCDCYSSSLFNGEHNYFRSERVLVQIGTSPSTDPQSTEELFKEPEEYLDHKVCEEHLYGTRNRIRVYSTYFWVLKLPFLE